MSRAPADGPRSGLGPQVRPGRAAWRRILSHRLATASMAILLLVFAASFLANPPGGGSARPAPAAAPSRHHLMGTTEIGDDLLVQVARGARRSIEVGVLVAALSTALGAAVGAIAGYYQGWVDAALARLVDLALTLPVLAVLLVVAHRLQSQRDNYVVIAVVISAVTWPGIARVVRAVFVSISQRDFAEAARAVGASDARIIVRHMLPTAVGPILVIATLTVAYGILAEAALAFLGFGATGSVSSLGALVSTGQPSASTQPWLFYYPGAALLLLCLCVNFVGDGLRDSLDPHRTDLVTSSDLRDYGGR